MSQISFQVTLDGALGEHGVKAVVGYTDYEFNNSLDSDFQPPKNYLNRGRNEQHEQVQRRAYYQLAKRRQVRVPHWCLLSDEELSNERYTHVDLSAVARQGGDIWPVNAPNPNLGGASFAAQQFS